MTEFDLSEGLKRLKLADFRKKIDDIADKLAESRLQQIEKLAAAYIVETGISPIDAVLIEETSHSVEDGQMRWSWHFERRDSYKVFVWPEVKSLSNYTRGVCLAVAPSKEEAISKIYESIRATISPPNDYPDWVREELQATEPEIVEMPDWPYVYWQWGSE